MTGQPAAIPPSVYEETLIKSLVKAMAHTPASHESIDAGYTYLGQFIAHELVEETNPRRGIKRSARPGMNLDSLYGVGCADLLDSRGLFPETDHDLPRRCGQAEIPDLRNDENIIVAQFHRLWQRFHNFTITSGCAGNVAEARRLVTLVFQLIVVEDFLAQLLNCQVFDSYFRLGERWLGFDVTSVPLEFSHAAFRFGHSMVRPTYSLSAARRHVPLLELFKPGQHIDPVSKIDWRGMFGWNDGTVQRARAIDPYVASEMLDIRGRASTTNIIERNLRSGFEAKLRAGQAQVDAILGGTNGKRIERIFGVARLDSLEPLRHLRGGMTASSGVTLENLPLWPYVLLEADLKGDRQRLGPMGSLICAEVLANSIACAQHSIFSCGEPMGWRSTRVELGALGKRLEAVRSTNAHKCMNTRALTMRHIVELLDAP